MHDRLLPLLNSKKIISVSILVVFVAFLVCGSLNYAGNDNFSSDSSSKNVLGVSLDIAEVDIIQDNSDKQVDITTNSVSDIVDITIDTSDNTSDTSTNSDIDSSNCSSSITEADLVPFNIEASFSYCSQPVCRFNKDTNQIDFTITFDSVPSSDDFAIYLFEIPTYEDDFCFAGKSCYAQGLKDTTVTISFPFQTHLLFSRFTPAVLYEGEYYPLSNGQYITNPEDVAKNNTPYMEVGSKKGLLLDPMTVDKKELNDLNVKRVVYNIPLSVIMGKTENEIYPTIDFEYVGLPYQFNAFALNGFDTLFENLTANGYHITVIILNDWNEYYPLLIHPDSRSRTGRSMYYAFNTTDESGVRIMEAAAIFLANRYASGEHGLVQDWIIANEVNQQKVWHYMATNDIDKFTDSFEKSFRTFYNAIKATYSNAHVSFSIDHDWNDNGGANSAFFNGKDILTTFNRYANLHGNYDWGLSIHPYPTPLTQTRFWRGYQNKTENATVITPMNMSVLTDFMKQEDMLDTSGNVRQIGVTELGFSSKSGEKTQAAAFAYCYYIIDDNEYIDSFLMNRQTDSYLSLQSGLALGIYNPDYTSKYIAEVFANIDTEKGIDYIPEMLEIIGSDSLSEALERAR